MKIERTKNATRNIVFGMILRIYQLLMPFLMRTVMIYVLGVNYLGLNGLFGSILQVLNLVELGVGSAMVYNMYQPIIDDDAEKICALMQLYKIYYRIIGLVVLVGGIIILPFLPNLIKSDLPQDINLYVLYLLNLGATVLTYWLFAYKNSLLQAYQRLDVSNKITIVTDTLKYILQLFVLFVFKNYYLYIISIILSQIVNNITTAVFVTKMYPNYDAKGKLPREEVRMINRKIKDLFTAKIGAVVFSSADTIVISAFLGLYILAIYQNYFYIISSLGGVFGIIYSSCIAGIGNSILVENKEKNYNDLKKFTFMAVWLVGICTVFLLSLMQPFMEIWVTSKLMLKDSAVICYCAYFFIDQINALLNIYKDASGIWHEDRFRPLMVSFTNLAINIVLVQCIGIYGVLFASFFAKTFVGMPWLLHNLFTTIFKTKPWEYVKELFYYTFSTIVACAVTFFLCSFIQDGGIFWFIVRAIICGIVGMIILFFFYHRKQEYYQVIEMIKMHVPHKYNKYLDYLLK